MPEAISPSLMGLAMASAGSAAELAGTGFVGHGEGFWQLLKETTRERGGCGFFSFSSENAGELIFLFF